MSLSRLFLLQSLTYAFVLLGCQRIFLEFGQKLSTVNRVCLTHISHDSIGGMPGLILTSADVLSSAIADAKAAIKPGEPKVPKQLPGLDVIGPSGTRKFIYSLRHFMRREAFELRIKEGAYIQGKDEKLKKQKRKRHGNEESFHVQSIACRRTLSVSDEHQTKRPRTERHDEFLSFIFTTPPIQGKFLAEKARQLGIPPGPLYGQLKAGKSITFRNKAGEDQTVESKEVVEPGSPGVAIGVFYYPSNDILDQICGSKTINECMDRNSQLEVMIHMAPQEIFLSDSCISWREGFGPDVQHVFLDTHEKNESMCGYNIHSGSPFQAALSGACSRSKLSNSIYTSMLLGDEVRNHPAVQEEPPNYVRARPLLEYVVLPRRKRGFCNHSAFGDNWEKLEKQSEEVLRSSNSVVVAKKILQNCGKVYNEGNGEILFCGTGSAIPCKHRNVSGIYLRMENSNSMLLDVGEGTVGQLLRAKKSENFRDVLFGIKAVWISHPHADHHLGILRLLTERKAITGTPLVLIAAPNLLSFLKEYEMVDASLSESYIFMDCRDIAQNTQQLAWSKERLEDHRGKMQKLENELGVVSCVSVPVSHCRHSYAVIIKGTSFGCVAYSGDCRPSTQFAKAALNADILIHEATFTDGMEKEAVLKKHSTVGEALGVGKAMNARTIVLTHFSQRYPKIPPLAKDESCSSNRSLPIFAFDFMRLTPGNLAAASKITHALRLLYPESDVVDEMESSDAATALEIPGLFAQKDVL